MIEFIISETNKVFSKAIKRYAQEAKKEPIDVNK